MRCSSVSSSLAALAAILLFACAGAPPAVSPVEERIDGTVAVDGRDPAEWRVLLARPDGSSLPLSAPRDEAELLRLDGIGVRVTGRLIDAGAEPVFAVSGYELLPIDGVLPLGGAVVRDGDDAFLRAAAGDGTTRLAGPLADALLAHEGFKVWVWGEFAEGGGRGALTVKAYGVLGPVSAPSRR